MAALRGLSPVVLQHQFVPTCHCQSQPYQQVAQLHAQSCAATAVLEQAEKTELVAQVDPVQAPAVFHEQPCSVLAAAGAGQLAQAGGMPPSLLFATHGRQLDARLFRIGPDCHAAASQLLWVRCAADFLPGFPAPCTFPTCMQGGIPCRRQWPVTASRFSIKGYARQLACG